MDQHQIITQLEEHAENIIKKTRKYLPHIGRFCLISTFVEDGIRMINQWGEQRDYIGKDILNHWWKVNLAEISAFCKQSIPIYFCISFFTKSANPNPYFTNNKIWFHLFW